MGFQLDNSSFMQGAQLKQRQHENFFDAITRGIQMAQRKEMMDLKKQRILADQAEKANDPTRLAQSGFMKLSQGTEPTPNEMAAMKLMDAQSMSKVKTDAYGNRITNQSMFKLIDPSAGKMQPVNTQSPAPQEGFNFDQFMPRITNKAEEMAYAAQLDLEKEKRKIEMQREDKAKDKETEKEELLPQAEKKLLDYATQQETILNSINKASDQTGVLSSGLLGDTAFVGGTPAANLKATLSTIQADSAFDTLQAMREASKTGGALGSVSERELTLLQNAKTALDQSQSPSQLRENLENYKKTREAGFERVKEAYKKDYGYLPEGLEGEKKQNKSSLEGLSKEQRYQLYLQMKGNQ